MTWEKAAAEVAVKRGRLSERTGSATSLPIEPIGSAPVAAIGVIRTRRSSWCSRTLLATGSADPGVVTYAVGEVVEMDRGVLEPFAVGLLVATSRLTSSSDDPPWSRSTRKSVGWLAGGRGASMSRRGDVEQAGSRAEHDMPSLVSDPAAGPQTVAVERGADHAGRR